MPLASTPWRCTKRTSGLIGRTLVAGAPTLTSRLTVGQLFLGQLGVGSNPAWSSKFLRK